MTASRSDLLESARTTPPWEKPWVLSLILVAITLAVFWPVWKFDFIDWDDWRLLAENPDFSPVNWSAIWGYWIHGHSNLYAPLTYTLWAVLAWFNQHWTGHIPLSPGIFHLANLLAHLVAVQFTFLLLRRLTIRALPAFAGAVVFAIHPLQVESVAWVASFNTVLCGALTAAALWLYIGHAQSATRRLSLQWFVASCLVLLLALCAKPMAISAVAMALLIDALILRRGFRQYWKPILIWAVLTIPFIIIGRLLQPPFTLTQTPAWTRPLVAADTTAFYLLKLIWPARLTLDYQRTPIWLLHTGRLWWTWVFPAALLALAIVWWKRMPTLLCGFAVMIVGILPVSGIVGFWFQRYSTVADRYMYLGMMGVAIVVAGFVAAYRKISVGCVGILLTCALMLRSSFRVQDWRNSVTITTNAQAFEENSAIAFKIRAAVLAEMGRLPEAVEQYQRALKFDPSDADTRYNFANLLYRMKQFQPAAREYRQALKEEPNRADIHYNYAVALMAMGQTSAAGSEFRKAVELDPASTLARLGYEKWQQWQKRQAPNFTTTQPHQ